MIQANDLEYWASLGHVHRVKDALQRGLGVNIRGESGYTALHAAAENGPISVLEILIEHGGNINAQVDDGWTPLDLANWPWLRLVTASQSWNNRETPWPSLTIPPCAISLI